MPRTVARLALSAAVAAAAPLLTACSSSSSDPGGPANPYNLLTPA